MRATSPGRCSDVDHCTHFQCTTISHFSLFPSPACNHRSSIAATCRCFVQSWVMYSPLIRLSNHRSIEQSVHAEGRHPSRPSFLRYHDTVSTSLTAPDDVRWSHFTDHCHFGAFSTRHCLPNSRMAQLVRSIAWCPFPRPLLKTTELVKRKEEPYETSPGLEDNLFCGLVSWKARRDVESTSASRGIYHGAVCPMWWKVYLTSDMEIVGRREMQILQIQPTTRLLPSRATRRHQFLVIFLAALFSYFFLSFSGTWPN